MKIQMVLSLHLPVYLAGKIKYENCTQQDIQLSKSGFGWFGVVLGFGFGTMTPVWFNFSKSRNTVFAEEFKMKQENKQTN